MRQSQNDIVGVQAAIDAGANVNWQNNQGDAALIQAASNDSIDITQILINAGADINIQDDQGNTALMWAKNNTISMLLYAGANLDLQSSSGNTALMLAVRFGELDIIQKLLRAGANINLQNNEGQTALMIAEYKGLPYLETFLIAIINANRSEDFNENGKELLKNQYNQFQNITNKTQEEQRVFAALEAILNPGLTTLW